MKFDMLENRVIMISKQLEIKRVENALNQENLHNLTIKHQNLQAESEMKIQDLEALLSEKELECNNLVSTVQNQH